MAKSVLVLGNIYFTRPEVDALASKDVKVVIEDSKSRDEFISKCASAYTDVEVLLCFGAGAASKFDRELVSKLPSSVKAVCYKGAGYNGWDVDALLERGIQMSNVAEAIDNATADTALYLTLGALRNFGHGARALRRGEWEHTTPEAHDPDGKVLGILGMGGIGQAYRDRASVFGFKKIIYHNRKRLATPKEEGNAEYVSFDDILAQSDVLSVHVPLNANTHHLIDAKALAKCKDGVYIVNTARGAVIDESALADALESGKVTAVGLDVFEEEPKINPRILAHPNSVLLPHLGTKTVESRRRMELETISNVVAFLEKGRVDSIVSEHAGKF